jgi:anaerobic selenocysteine-containing dehydrogenase/Fe-S-cluster-containing dehydrogenase component
MSDGMKRRDFLKVLGVSGAGAATVGCTTREVERLIPYVVQPEEIVPGIPTWYASTCRECPAGCGIHVETHSGRATKVEGNPEHPISRGNLCARGQASVQGLYHPDRFRGPIRRDAGVGDREVSWGVAERMLAQRIRELGTAGQAGSVVLLTGRYGGTMDQLADQWAQSVGARRVVWEPFAGQPHDLEFADADVLISFGADFLETWGSPVDYAAQFALFREPRDGTRGRFVWIAPHRPLTGLNADQWIAPRPGTEILVASALLGEIDHARAARETGVDEEVLSELAALIQGRRVAAFGPGVGYSGRDSAPLRRAVARLNGGSPQAEPQPAGMAEMVQLVEEMRAGQVQVLLVDAADPVYSLPGGLGFAEALQRVPMRVSFSSFPDDTAVLATMNLPDHHFLEAWGDYSPRPGVNLLVQPSMRPVFNTKQVGDVLLSVARQAGADPGTEAATFYDYLRLGWQALAPGDAWREALKRGGVYEAVPPEGLLPRTAPGADLPAVAAVTGEDVEVGEPAPVTPAVAAAPATPFGTRPAPVAPPATRHEAITFDGLDHTEFNLVVYPSYRFFDGRNANLPWLMELPDPVTKVTWESWLEMHPRAAEATGLRQGDLVEVTSPYGSIRLPVFIYPGVRPDTVAVQMGLGHEGFGRYTAGWGSNPNRLLGPDLDPQTGEAVRYGLRVRLGRAAAPDSRHWQGLFEQGVRIQHDRELARAVSLASFAETERTVEPWVPGEEESVKTLRGAGGFVPVEETTDPGAYPPHGTHYGEYIEGATRWAMAIDLSRCIGCAACVVACNAENNIPVVGLDQMKRGREMHWLRIERYWGVSRDPSEAFTDDATDDTRFLPMLCQHCGNAPCEPVCPVYAAYHTPDGLNAQVYNRCVGTRYCANNCPWKVRVFNWYTWEIPTPYDWQLNPDVTVREKGVMEKCTFCVQRIREGERRAHRENRQVRDADVVPACVQTCPTEVFVFGNINDPESAVASAARSTRGYRSLGELNTQPAIVYLKKVTLHEPAVGGHH